MSTHQPLTDILFNAGAKPVPENSRRTRKYIEWTHPAVTGRIYQGRCGAIRVGATVAKSVPVAYSADNIRLWCERLALRAVTA